MKRVLVLLNPKSGLPRSFGVLRRALDAHWDVKGVQLYYQFSQSKEDGTAKAERAVAEGVDTILVAGGDGTINTIGRVLVGTRVALGAIPFGSGNGFARHFNIPLAIDKAVAALATGSVRPIDVGRVDGQPTLVTCSMAWDAAIARSFEKYPVRGILPYIFAGVQEYFDYRVQPMTVRIDGGEPFVLQDPAVFTVANLTQYGGGVLVAPLAQADDGYLELVVVLRRDLPWVLAQVPRLFDGSLNDMPEVLHRRFKSLTVERPQADAIQIDGEFIPAGRTVHVDVQPAALNVLVPEAAAR